MNSIRVLGGGAENRKSSSKAVAGIIGSRLSLGAALCLSSVFPVLGPRYPVPGYL